MPPQDRTDDAADWPLGRLLSAAARLVEHEWNAHLAAWGLTHAGVAVLHVLQAQGPMSQRELAGVVQVEDQTMSRLLERLEREGRVRRTRDERDRRRLLVALTPPGARALAEAADPHLADALVTDALGSAEEVAALRRALTAVVRHRASGRWAPPPA